MIRAGPSSPARASLAQREHAASTLSDALSDGEITIREFDERSAAVWKATFSDELEPLTADLAPVDAPSHLRQENYCD